MSSLRLLRAFTLVELIVVFTILSILGMVGVVTYSSYLENANDAKRIADINLIKTNLATYHRIHAGKYPIPQEYTMIMTGSTLVAYETAFDAYLSSLVDISNVLTDPKSHVPYLYSVSADASTYQIAATLEDGEHMVAFAPIGPDRAYADSHPVAFVEGDYMPADKTVIP